MASRNLQSPLAGIFLACVAGIVFLLNDFRAEIPELDRRLAPVLAAGIAGALGLVVACFWVVYQSGAG